MKDYKLSEIMEICHNNRWGEGCSECEIFDFCQKGSDVPEQWQEQFDFEEPLKAKYKKGDIVYAIETVGVYHPQKGSYLIKDTVERKIKAVRVGKTKVSYSLYKCKHRIDERWLFATRAEALEIINRGK